VTGGGESQLCLPGWRATQERTRTFDYAREPLPGGSSCCGDIPAWQKEGFLLAEGGILATLGEKRDLLATSGTAGTKGGAPCVNFEGEKKK